MSFPCVDGDYFEVVDGELSPHDYLQWRQVATGSAAGTTVDPLTDTAQVLSHDFVVAWTNSTPISQHAYGLCTRSASTVVTTAAKRFCVEQRRGWVSGVAPADPPVTSQTSKHGGGIDRSTFNSGANSVYGVWEHRQGASTTPIGPDVILTPGQTLKVRVAVYVVRDSWAQPQVSQYVPEEENRIETGGTRLDIFAYPVLP